MTIGKLSGQCDFGQKGQSYCNQRGQSCVAKRVKVAWLFQRLTILLLILSVRFRDKIEFQVFIRPFPVQVDVEVEADVPVRQLLAPDPDRFFDLRHILLR